MGFDVIVKDKFNAWNLQRWWEFVLPHHHHMFEESSRENISCHTKLNRVLISGLNNFYVNQIDIKAWLKINFHLINSRSCIFEIFYVYRFFFNLGISYALKWYIMDYWCLSRLKEISHHVHLLIFELSCWCCFSFFFYVIGLTFKKDETSRWTIFDLHQDTILQIKILH